MIDLVHSVLAAKSVGLRMYCKTRALNRLESIRTIRKCRIAAEKGATDHALTVRDGGRFDVYKRDKEKRGETFRGPTRAASVNTRSWVNQSSSANPSSFSAA